MTDLGGGTSTEKTDAELLEEFRPLLEAARNRAPRTVRRRRAPTAAIERRRERDRLEVKALEQRPSGPNLPPWLMHNARVYVVAQDLEDLPDGGGFFREHWGELALRAAAVGMLPMEFAALNILVWCHERRPGGDGAGFQSPIEVLARKLPGEREDGSASRSWVYEIIDRLEQRGLVKRFRRVRRYAHCARELGAGFTGPDGNLVTWRRWRDGGGKLRSFVDLCGVTYATPKAVALVRSAERGRRGELLPQNLWTALWGTLKRAARAVTARLRLASAPKPDRTPYTVEAEVETIYRGPYRKLQLDTGPPSG